MSNQIEGRSNDKRSELVERKVQAEMARRNTE